MTSSRRKFIALLVIACIILAVGWFIIDRFHSPKGQSRRGKKDIVIPVEVAQIKTGPITHKRTFSGTLEATAEFIVAPKVSGRVERLHVDFSDTVNRGQRVAELDNAEYIQQLTQAKADLAVSKANLVEAKNALIIANRELERILTLKNRGIKSESQLDVAKTNQLERQAHLEVAKAQVIRSEAAVETANIRLGYTKITAAWSGDDDFRVVAERFIDEGDTVSANTALMSIIRLNPIMGVIFITEKDYSRLNIGQSVFLSTDAFAQTQFTGKIARIAPVFKEETRQARIEISIDNPEKLLKPGMFIRATIVLDHMENAVIIPEQALTKRDGQYGVFRVVPNKPIVRWQPVTVGITEGDRVAVDGLESQGTIVVLGQQMLNDGTQIIIPENQTIKNHGVVR